MSGLNHLPAKETHRLTGAEGSNPSASAIKRMGKIMKKRTKRRLSSMMGRSGPLTQTAAMCFRGDEVLLITSRDTGRWILPKGWKMKGKSLEEAALIEAHEEAGVIGEVNKTPLGHYTYMKIMNDGSIVPVKVIVHSVTVTNVTNEYKEAGQRQSTWVSPKKASFLVNEDGLRNLFWGM